MATKDITIEKGFLLTNDDQGGFSTGLTNPATYDECSKFSNPAMLFFQQAGYGRLSMNQILPGGSYRFGNGTVSAPAVSWAADIDTGRYLIAASNPAESVDSTLVYDWTASRVKFSKQVQFTDGTASAPGWTFYSDTGQNTGAYLIGQNNIGFSSNGTLQWDYNTTRLYSQDQVIYMGVDAQIYPTSYISIDKTLNGNALITLRNQSAGGNANCGLYLLNDALTAGVQYGLTGTGWSTFGNFQANEAFIACDSGVSLLINVPSGEQFRLATGNVVHWTMNADGNLTWAQTLATSGSPVMMTMTGAAHLQLAADTEASDVSFNMARSVEFTTGAGTFSDQRVVKFLAPTYTATAATETITRAATVYIDRAPQAGTNLNITSAYALWVDDGAVRIDGALTAGSVTLSGFTQGSVLFAGASGIVAEDNANLFFDDSSNYLKVGGFLRVGSDTSAAATGDFSAGATNVLFYDESLSKLSLTGAATTISLTGSGTGVLQLGTNISVRAHASDLGPTIRAESGAMTVSLYRVDGATGNVVIAEQQWEATNSTPASYSACAIQGVQTSNTAGAETAFLSFYTRNSGTRAEKFRIAADGRIAIGDGTAFAPTEMIHIEANTGSGAAIRMKRTGATTADWYLVPAASGVANQFGIYDGVAAAYRLTFGATGGATIHQWSNVGTATEAVAQGDFAAGLTTAATMFWDQSLNRLKLGIPETPGLACNLEVYGAGGSFQIWRDTTNNVETFAGANSAGGFIGTITSHVLFLQPGNTTRATVGTTEFVVNDSQSNYDFRVESDNEANAIFVDASADVVYLGGTDAWRVSDGAGLEAQGNRRFSHGTSALATNATEGFFHIQTCAGAPSGTPASIPTGQMPMVFDTTNDRLYFYYDDGGGAGWHYIARTA